MNLRLKLSQRIGMNDMLEINYIAQNSDRRKQELYDLVFDIDASISYNAAWCLTHFSLFENQWLYNKQDELIQEVITCQHPGKRRLILTLLYRQPLANPPRLDFLDFCMERMISKKELPGVQTLCLKLAYELCRPIPELCQEFRTMLEIMEPDLLPISIRTVRKNLLKAMLKGKSLQLY